MNPVGIDELIIRRRHLPHWRTGAATYFVTFRALFNLSTDARQVVVDTIRRGEVSHFNLFIAAVMVDHVHLILFPLEVEDGQWRDLSQITKGMKGASARAINRLLNRTGNVWQDESYDRIIRNEREMRQTWDYIYLNPVRAGLVEEAEDYPFLIYPSEDSVKRILA